MTDRPTLHLGNLGTLREHPGRKLCAMANPRGWERGDGRVGVAAPSVADLAAVRDAGFSASALRVYRGACERQFAVLAETGRYDPAFKSAVTRGADGRPWRGPLVDGDALFCACAAPMSPRRRHPCHLELLTPFLVLAGWDVVLWGRRVILGGPSGRCPDCGGGLDENDECPAWYEGGRSLPVIAWPIYADTHEEMRPEDYGWPEARHA